MDSNPVVLWIAFALGVAAALLGVVHVFQKGSSRLRTSVTRVLGTLGLMTAGACSVLLLLSLLPALSPLHDALNTRLDGKLYGAVLCALVAGRFASQLRKPHRPLWYDWAIDVAILAPAIWYTVLYATVGGPGANASVLALVWIVGGLLVLSDVVLPLARVVARRLDALIDTPWGVPLVVVVLTITGSLLGTLDALGIFR